MKLIISTALLEDIGTQARISAPNECCGLLLGAHARGGSALHVTALMPAENIAATPHHRFEVDPAVLIAAHRAARQGGPAVLGHYHSHPAGLAQPSAIDASMARGGELWLIVGGDGVITGWRAAPPGASVGPGKPHPLHDCFEAVELTGSPQGALAPAASGRHESPTTA